MLHAGTIDFCTVILGQLAKSGLPLLASTKSSTSVISSRVLFHQNTVKLGAVQLVTSLLLVLLPKVSLIGGIIAHFSLTMLLWIAGH